MKTKFISYTRNLKTINFMLHNTNYMQGTVLVGFTLSQATKALRESRGIALLCFRPLH